MVFFLIQMSKKIDVFSTIFMKKCVLEELSACRMLKWIQNRSEWTPFTISSKVRKVYLRLRDHIAIQKPKFRFLHQKWVFFFSTLFMKKCHLGVAEAIRVSIWSQDRSESWPIIIYSNFGEGCRCIRNHIPTQKPKFRFFHRKMDILEYNFYEKRIFFLRFKISKKNQRQKKKKKILNRKK